MIKAFLKHKNPVSSIKNDYRCAKNASFEKYAINTTKQEKHAKYKIIEFYTSGSIYIETCKLENVNTQKCFLIEPTWLKYRIRQYN